MPKIALRNEILFRAPARVGLLADVTERLYATGVNVLAIRAYEEAGEGVFLIYADDSRAAIEAIETLREGAAKTTAVISAEVRNEPGPLAAISRALANADINVTQVHCTTTDAPTAGIVLQTDDNVAAMAALEKLKG
jgi:hypothetical protein